MNLFRVRGIQLAVHFSFFLMLAYFAQSGWEDADDGGWPGLLWSVATLVAFFGCVVLHELGHSFTAMSFGIGVRRILLMPIGGMAEMDDIPRQPSRELLITLAGPAVNFVIAAGLWLVVRRFNDDVPVSSNSLAGLAIQLFWANIVMGCFNLQPAFPMDGGRILRALLAWRMPYLKATLWAAKIGKVICILGFSFALLAPVLGIVDHSLWMLAALYAFIFFAGEMEYKFVKRREAEDAHWRAVLARAYAAHLPPPTEEPPVLSR